MDDLTWPIRAYAYILIRRLTNLVRSDADEPERLYPRLPFVEQLRFALVEPPTEIFRHPTNDGGRLLLGGAVNAIRHVDDVEAIVNCSSRDVPSFVPRKSYFDLRLDDTAQQKLTMRELDRAAAFVEFYLRRGQNVLIHCVFGASRSSSVAAYYMLKYHAIPIDEAFDSMHEKRACVNPNMNFVHAMERARPERRLDDVLIEDEKIDVVM